MATTNPILDLSCGAVLGSRQLIAGIKEVALCYGGNLNAEDCSLLERSLKTLSLRVERQSANAMLLAEALQGSEGARRVYYPGIDVHPTYGIASRQMSGFGGMLSFEIAGNAQRFMRSLKLITPALSLGGVESTICTPATTSHRHTSPEQRQAVGISDDLLRLSVGIEDGGDLLDDLLQALDNCLAV